MDPIFLTFANPALEAGYVRYAAGINTGNADVCFCWWTFIVRAMALWQHGCQWSYRRYALSGAHLVWVIAEVLLQRSLRRSHLWMQSEALVVISRVIHTLNFGTSFDEVSTGMCTLDTHGVTGPLSTHCVLEDGLLPLVFLALLKPLRFRLHLPVQLFSLAFFLTTINPESCRATDSVGTAGMKQAMEILDAMAKCIVGAVFATRFDHDPSWKVEYPHLQMALFSAGYIGFGIMTYILWVKEHITRLAFIETLREEDKPEESVKPLAGSAVMLHTVILIAAFGIFWRVFLGATPGFVRWTILSGWHPDSTSGCGGVAAGG